MDVADRLLNSADGLLDADICVLEHTFAALNLATAVLNIAHRVLSLAPPLLNVADVVMDVAAGLLNVAARPTHAIIALLGSLAGRFAPIQRQPARPKHPERNCGIGQPLLCYAHIRKSRPST